MRIRTMTQTRRTRRPRDVAAEADPTANAKTILANGNVHEAAAVCSAAWASRETRKAATTKLTTRR